MTFWDGTRWVPDEELHQPNPRKPAGAPRLRIAMSLGLALLLLVPLQAGVLAASKTGATLSVVFASSATTGSIDYGTPYTVTGCGYNAAYGGVTVVVQSPEAISFAGQMPDANGCITVTNFSTQGAGTYDLTAYQTIHRKSQAMASTSFTLP